jgi:hypothetical protein
MLVKYFVSLMFAFDFVNVDFDMEKLLICR